jgi:hypothetical protein
LPRGLPAKRLILHQNEVFPLAQQLRCVLGEGNWLAQPSPRYR